jgi:hypothetical protein
MPGVIFMALGPSATRCLLASLRSRAHRCRR